MGELETALTALEQGEVALSPVYRESPGGESEQIAEGYERQVAMSCEANGDSQSWTERRLVVRSLRHAKAAEASLRTRVALSREIEGSDIPVAAAHFPDLQFGRLLQAEGKRRWVV